MDAFKRFVFRSALFLCRSPMKEACAEFLATFFLVLCGDGVMATITLGRLDHNATIISAFGWGLALTIAITISGGISGGHVNPAVTMAMATVKKCPWDHTLPYIASQHIGGFLAAAVVHGVYYDAINEFDQGVRQLPPHVNSTAQIFSTYPQDYVSIGSCFADQVVGTALLLIVISAVTDQKNTEFPAHFQSPIIGLGLTTIILAFGQNCGAPLNPARDLSPRIFTAIAGWGVKAFSVRDYMWFWIPILGPYVGGILGVWIYRIFIDMPFGSYELFCEPESVEALLSEVEQENKDAEKEPSQPSLEIAITAE